MERAAGSCHRFVCGPKKDKIFQIAQNGRVLCGYYAHDAGLGLFETIKLNNCTNGRYTSGHNSLDTVSLKLKT